MHTDLNNTYYSVFSQAQQRVTRIVQELVEFIFTDLPGSTNNCLQCLNRTNSCPDLREGISKRPLGPNIQNSILSRLHYKETQTSLNKLSICDTSAQYSAQSEASETDYISKEESLPEETRCDYHKTNLKYTNLPQDRNRIFTPIPDTQVPRHAIEEIIHHPQAFHMPPVEIIVVPGQQATNQAVNQGIQRVQGVQGMARRWGQLQGADPALV